MSGGESKKKCIIPVIIILITLSLLSGCVNLTCSYISDSLLNNGWYEDLSLRNTGSQFLGLDKWCSSTYEIQGKYPATLTLTTMKSLVLSDENELFEKTKDAISKTFKDRFNITEVLSGERTISKGHKSHFSIYDGIDSSSHQKVRLIGEVWNCATSGTSIICVGFAYTTNENLPDVENLENWQKIVMDPSGTIDNSFGEIGLIYNVDCH